MKRFSSLLLLGVLPTLVACGGATGAGTAVKLKA